MDLRMKKSVREVIQIGRDENGKRCAATVYKKRGERKKKGTWGLSQIGKLMRKVAVGQRAAADVYLKRHNESNRKKADGWLFDLPYNVYRATRRGLKKVTSAVPLPAVESEDD
jgi:hypothetical protein